MKAARPAKAATNIEPWTVDAAPVIGEEVAVGAVTLWGTEMVPVVPTTGDAVVAAAAGVETTARVEAASGDEVGVTVTVE